MNDELERFLEEVRTDSELRERITSMQTAAEVVEEAAQRGFNFSEDDLSTISGAEPEKPGILSLCYCFIQGAGNNYNEPGVVPYECACCIFGAGVDDNKDYRCICGAAGKGRS